MKKLSPISVVAIAFVVLGVVFNLLVLGAGRQSFNAETAGGPYLAVLEETVDWGADSVLAENVFIGEFDIAQDEDATAGFVVMEGDSVLNAANPLSTVLPTRDGLLVYKVQKGDTLSKIAANFGISLNTIFWANSKLSSSIRPGQELVILPVSGVIHQTEEGETIESVAEIYNVPAEKIIQHNRKFANNRPVPAGTTLVIPGAKPKKTLAAASLSGLPSYPGYYIIPTTGWNWGKLHYFNAIDIANACGTPVYAAAEGLVIRELSYGYNDGYGHYIDIEHPNDTITRYAHISKSKVAVGDYVLQGDLIGYIGNSGKTDGPTGCHLHFEIRGAKNLFAK